MKKFYFVGQRPDEIQRSPFLYLDESDAWDDLMAYPKDTKYRVFEVLVKECEIGAKNAQSK